MNYIKEIFKAFDQVKQAGVGIKRLQTNEEVAALIKKVEPYLGLEGTKFEWVGVFGINGYANDERPDTIFISCWGQRLIETIVHEMVHLAQYRFEGFRDPRGMSEEDCVAEWRGQKVRFTWKDYANLPWEREARTKSRYIMNALGLQD